MFQVLTERLYELGFYHTITDQELIKDLKKRMTHLNMKSVNNEWRPNHNLIISVGYRGVQAQLLLTKIYDMTISILYLVKDDKFIITNHRFEPSLYHNTVLFGDLFGSTFIIHCVSFGDKSEKTVENIEKMDGILFNKYKEDLDLEPIGITLKEFYDSESEIRWHRDYKSVLYLNYMVNGQHFIKFR